MPKVVRSRGFEPLTPPMSRECSNRAELRAHGFRYFFLHVITFLIPAELIVIGIVVNGDMGVSVKRDLLTLGANLIVYRSLCIDPIPHYLIPFLFFEFTNFDIL